MIRNYFKVAWRNIIRSPFSSVINIGGLSMGMTVAMLIGLWIRDELSFDRFHQHYDRIAQVMEKDSRNGVINTGSAVSLPLEAALRKNYGSYFTHIAMASWTEPHVLIAGDKKITYPGNFIGAEGPELFTLHMLKGSREGLRGPSSMLISRKVADALFGDKDPMGRLISLDDKVRFSVSGVYEDLPQNTSLHEVAFMAPWDFYVSHPEWISRDPGNWNDNSLFMYVQAAGHEDIAQLSEKIKNIKLDNGGPAVAGTKPEIFLQPMSRWHLYAAFTNGINTGGAVQYVWLFGIIGMFVLLLACINFMNLSTAKSEKRAREVGIRKAMGSLRASLIGQFLCESLLIALLAFILSLVIAWLALPLFNQVSGKNTGMGWSNPSFWIWGLGFTVITGIMAGSYPALYLSSFRPSAVLKGGFRAGRLASLPRKMLVVVQFTVSIILIIGTMVVFQQIQYAKNRPIGYNRNGLVNIEATNEDISDHFTAFRESLLTSGAVAGMAASSSPATAINYTRDDVDWSGKDPTLTVEFGNIHVTTDYGRTLGWQFKEGRDFSSQPGTDSFSVILNESAVNYMGLRKPVGETLKVGKRNLHVIGVVRDMVMESPYKPAKPSIFVIGGGHFDDIIVRINPRMSMQEALGRIAGICKTYSPKVPFAYKFVDEEYEKKFAVEERIGQLAGIFTILAIFISCLGLFGMASYVAEQRTKELGVRKVLGASVWNLWSLLSKDFVVLVLLSSVLAGPLAYYFLHEWLLTYAYRTEIGGWIFVAATAGALVITIVTVSYQSIRAALMNPVNSLRSE